MQIPAFPYQFPNTFRIYPVYGSNKFVASYTGKWADRM